MITYLWSLVGFRGLSASAIGLLIATPVTLYSVGAIRKDKLRSSMFNAGFIVSQKFKKIPFWDKYVEPAFVKNFATFVIAGNALLEGMVSDNEVPDDKANGIVNDMQKMREDIKQDLEEFEKIDQDENIPKGDPAYTQITNKISDKIKNFLYLDNKAHRRVFKLAKKLEKKTPKSDDKDNNNSIFKFDNFS